MGASPASRAAARIERELGLPVERESGDRGELSVFVDDVLVIESGAFRHIGIHPSARRIFETVRERVGHGQEA